MLISIITVVKNDEKNIFNTLQSVKSQTYNDIEHIIIDGKSSDSTFNKIKNFNFKHKFFFSSSKDINIYDALNKGIQKSNGDIIGILHSGDKFYNKNVVSTVVKYFKLNYDCIAGNILFTKNKKIKRIWKTNIKNFSKYNFYKIPHTSLFIKKKKLNIIGNYDIEYSIASDTDFIIRLLKTRKRFFYINDFIVNMSFGGMSTNFKYLFKKIYQDLVILYNHFGILFIILYIKKIIFKIIINRNAELTKK